MKRKDCPETDSLRKQSLERYGKEVWGTQSRDVRTSHLRGNVHGVTGLRAFQTTGRQQGTQLAENVYTSQVNR